MRPLITRWTDRPLRSKSLVIIALPLAVLLISLVLVYITERQTSRVEDDVRRALRVQGDVQAVHSLLAEAAASVRGYLLIQRNDFLPSYRSAVERIDSALQRLDTDIRDPQMRSSLQRLRPLIVIKLQGLEQLMALASSEDRAAMTRILVDNKHVLDDLRLEIQQMLEREQALLDERNVEAGAVRSRMLLATGLSAAFGVLGALFAVSLLSTGIVHRVQQVERNARRLALGQPLIAHAPGADEIGQLAASLEEAGQLLAERERALRDNEERLRLIIDGVKEYGIFGLDPSGHVTSWNTGAERIKGYREADILGRHFSLFYPPQARDTAPQHALQVATREGRYEEEAWRQRRDGSLFWANVVITAQRDASGTLRGFSKITRDITDRRNAEAALRTAREEAENASRAKSEFLSRMSHELRTPLNSILGFAQLLEMDKGTPAQQAQVRHILRAGRHLLGLINEVLDIARIESGRLALSPEPLALRPLLQEVSLLLSPQAAAADIRLHLPGDLPATLNVQADRQRLVQVLLNLLSNAIKYNHRGGQVEVQVEADARKVALSVIDNGPGIALEDQQRLFTPFERLGAATSEVEGTGLGLALSKSLLEQMDGSLSVNSAPGQGSTFRLTLPRSQAGSVVLPVDTIAPSAAINVTAPPEQPLRVLCIEDNLSSLALIETLLSRWPQVQVISAMQGQLGLDLAWQHRPEVILLDLDLPDLSGQEVLKRLRLNTCSAATPVLLITADASAATQRDLLASGASAVLSKPLHVPTFLATLRQHLDAARPAATTQPESDDGQP
ncbi:MAG: PAS domain S-box protein [Gammaproteobacteria bacterium]|nr:PAS domain S-box protein [Gammaproteobacteria bacterium]MBU1488871.1 PAS domain S-box protein [Gammaproteobacteria bacterium]MBU2067426.1 PAS domain S-box protein [Gammaproteobacteria bacterium]MBU2138861.1 PAS domain S-box protein [Gammaproteobacteria bacterium]MBU2216684.1 PAS domain S-box protein [Gammaproteobacteria bacterium]